MGISGGRRDRRLSPYEVTLLRALLTLGSLLAGAIAGLTAAAFGLLINGHVLFDMEPARAQLLLVVGPLLGLWPPAALAFVAAHSPQVRRWTLALLGLWLASALAATVGFGFLSLFRR